ncbi:hypothetical protein, partial [Enterobacter hormaechei]|uniref:hypothetical protein n=1 Tax=Enterobacter hormaechei TaxID=158836 RepID=UPI0013D444DA
IGGIGATNTLTIQCAGSDVINGASTKILRAAYAGAEFISDGATRWTSISTSAAALTTVAGRLARFI